MKWLTDFWKMRRRYGSVKAAVLLFIFALYFIIQSVTAVVKYAEFAGGNVEYMIAVSNPEGVQNSDLAKLQGLDHVICISPQKVYNLTYINDSESKALPVTEVYADYLQKAYGIHAEAFETCFHLNEKAWREIANDSMEESINMLYSIDEIASKTARFVLEDKFEDSAPMAYTSGDSVSLAGCMSVRMMTEKTDITGKMLEEIHSLGYAVENEQEILEGIRELEMVMMKVKYGLIIAGLATLLGCVLMKQKEGHSC